MSDWKPIETAPKGEPMLTYHKAGLMAVAEWWPDTKWIVSDGCEIVGVTHWMPLPDPPKETDRK